MAVAYVSDVDKAGVVSTSSDVFTSFAVSGTNPAIIIMTATADVTISSIVLSAGLTGGTPYQVIRATGAASNRMNIWAVPAPTGTGTITITYSGATDHQTNVILFSGADQTTPAIIAEAASTTGSTSPLTITPSNLTANDAVAYGGSQSTTGDSPHVQTGIETFFDNTTNVNCSYGYHLGTGAVSVAWGATSVNEVVVGVRVQAAAATTLPPGLGPAAQMQEPAHFDTAMMR